MEVKEYNLRLSLQQMALRRIAIILWNRYISDSLSSSTQQTLEFLVKEVKQKVSLLSLPSSIEIKLVDLILPIGTEIQRWEKYHRSFLPLTVTKSQLGQLCWTSQGTVDYRKTAERLIRLERVSNVSCYIICCLYCFDEDIQKFWKELDESFKKTYYYGTFEDDYYEDEYHEDEYYENELWRIRRANLVTLWNYYLQENNDFILNHYKDEHKLTCNQYAFESAALSGNKVATEYFLGKLTFEEREASLMVTVRRVIETRCFGNNSILHDFPKERFSYVVIYLLAQMSKAEQTRIFQKQSFATLVCFLDWPWQELFMDIAEQMWTYLSFDEYRKLLTVVSADYNKSAFDYGNIFVELFLRSPNHYRNNLFVDLSFESKDSPFPILFENLPDFHMEWFSHLIKTNKLNCIKLVLRSMNRAEREKLITREFIIDLRIKLVNEDKWFLLELILEESGLSKEAKESLKLSFMERFVSKQKFCYINRMSMLRKKKYLNLVDKYIRVSDKRRVDKLETEKSAPPKKKS